MTKAIPSIPAYECPLRNYTLVTVATCNKCGNKEDFTEYYAPREGGVIYCKYDWLKDNRAPSAKAANL